MPGLSHGGGCVMACRTFLLEAERTDRHAAIVYRAIE